MNAPTIEPAELCEVLGCSRRTLERTMPTTVHADNDTRKVAYLVADLFWTTEPEEFAAIVIRKNLNADQRKATHAAILVSATSIITQRVQKPYERAGKGYWRRTAAILARHAPGPIAIDLFPKSVDAVARGILRTTPAVAHHSL